MLFKGTRLSVASLGDGLVEMCFDRSDASTNKMDKRMLAEWGEATALLASMPNLAGVLVTSGKPVFIVGADIDEFRVSFKADVPHIIANTLDAHRIANAFEDLPVPSVAAINGFALGGGLELALTACYRVMSTQAQVGLPEVKLGLFPGLAGTVRMPRVTGAETAIDWIAQGHPHNAEEALRVGVVDEVAEPAVLREQALACLRRAASGALDWRARQRAKRVAMTGAPQGREPVFASALARLAEQARLHQPAAAVAVELMHRSAGLDRTDAIALEVRQFAMVTKTQAATSLVQSFHNDQALKKLYREHARRATRPSRTAVVGAGIMGSGIAFASASHNIPVRMKDASQAQLDIGMAAVASALARGEKTGRYGPECSAQVRAQVVGQLDFAGFGETDLVMEAVVEDITVKRRVLLDLEQVVPAGTVLASTTSSLGIDALARGLKRPENFLGMHFLNPVASMPLVEIVRTSRTSENAVSAAVGYAVAMGKTPIVVKDCPGFLVNRILAAYLRAFMELVADGVDFVAIDQAMEEFGWPLGPAALEDAVGLDFASEVNARISAGYSARMPPLRMDAAKLLADHGRLGQKGGAGFYRYECDASGRLQKRACPEASALLAPGQARKMQAAMSKEAIVERMMLALILEAAHALEEGVVATPGELDMALILGASFPKYLGGPLKYADWLGMDALAQRAERLADLGVVYRLTPGMREMAATGARYYP
jgi:3-hydroxyacyl-CoA dehydrogenase/enoyl-CoA hydratase/3-hydroxybutyryl-CoA epimerase/enoyl-CoA isomerase